MKDFGVNIEDIGVHSLRKGAASYVSSGSTCSPPQVATNIRAGWSMGIIQDTYLRYEAAGDQYVGRVVSGLPLSSPKFAVLPCQVDCSVDECEEMLSSLFPTVPGNLHCLCRFFAAAILYHFPNFLNIILPPTHPFFSSLLLTSSKIPKLIKQTFVKYAWEECSDISVFRGEYDTMKDGELSTTITIGDTVTNTRDPLDDSVSLEPQVTEASVPRRTPRISKATGIPTHVMLLADMQKVIEAQHHFLFKMKTVIN